MLRSYEVSNPCGIYFNNEKATFWNELSKFQIPVGYILTKTISFIQFLKDKFQIPVGYILTYKEYAKKQNLIWFQIPVGYILT